MIDIEWDASESSGSRRRYRKASTIHGWVTKLRGTLSGNERVRSRGIREMREARAIREYEKKRGKGSKQQRKHSNPLYWFSFWPSKRQPSQGQIVRRSHSHARPGSGRRMHSSQRSKQQQQHGRGTRVKGYLLGNDQLVKTGKQMNKDVVRERDSERRRRQRRSKRHV